MSVAVTAMPSGLSTCLSPSVAWPTRTWSTATGSAHVGTSLPKRSDVGSPLTATRTVWPSITRLPGALSISTAP